MYYSKANYKYKLKIYIFKLQIHILNPKINPKFITKEKIKLKE